ncbi:hypothetical protein SEEN4881_20048 [Salmonella enterica subsp. enterica serovar Newport str. WA_14881]|nr:hypothetical protein SEEN4881_20048 [Salmonella enterica subsp. enterica serovar Newport str. WA_14881]
MVSGGGSGVWSGALNGVPSGKIPDASFSISLPMFSASPSIL